MDERDILHSHPTSLIPTDFDIHPPTDTSAVKEMWGPVPFAKEPGRGIPLPSARKLAYRPWSQLWSPKWPMNWLQLPPENKQNHMQMKAFEEIPKSSGEVLVYHWAKKKKKVCIWKLWRGKRTSTTFLISPSPKGTQLNAKRQPQPRFLPRDGEWEHVCETQLPPL